MSIQYVTSFAPDMYATTGHNLIASFLESGAEGTMVVCHEGGLADRIERDVAHVGDRIITYDLDTSEFLRDWLDRNRDIIPVTLGGAAPPCACAKPDNPMSAHAPRCPYGWFNKNASRWFRKIVSLELACSLNGAEALVWLDSDCRFKRGLPTKVWTDLFRTAAVLYHKGPQRKVIESGVIAFQMTAAGRRLLHIVIERFRSGEFRADLRWDDGYQFQMVVDAHPEIPARDLAEGSALYDMVLPTSPLGEFLDHFKGVHGEVLRIMR
jgi:hypothetical protein